MTQKNKRATTKTHHRLVHSKYVERLERERGRGLGASDAARHGALGGVLRRLHGTGSGGDGTDSAGDRAGDRPSKSERSALAGVERSGDEGVLRAGRGGGQRGRRGALDRARSVDPPRHERVLEARGRRRRRGDGDQRGAELRREGRVRGGHGDGERLVVERVEEAEE